MKKLRIESLQVESFHPAREPNPTRGTVVGAEIDTTLHCPDSYGGTCWVTCWETCYCDTSPYNC